jgi:uncharacterized protein YndB with AHSA1/START domain
MAIIKETVEIKFPVDKVFAYVADAKSWPKWHLSMLEANQTSSGQMGIGTTFGGVNKVMGRRMPWTSKVTEYVANKKWSETISSGSTLIKEQITCDPIEGGTKFTEVYDMKVGGFLKLLSPMVISSMQKEMKSNLSSLKSILEAKA